MNILLWSIFVSFFSLLSPLVHAQPVQSERLRIEAERRQIELDSAVRDAGCYEKFAVNRCLADTTSQRSIALADLRRQDVLLNDGERKKRAANQIRKAEQKRLSKDQN